MKINIINFQLLKNFAFAFLVLVTPSLWSVTTWSDPVQLTSATTPPQGNDEQVVVDANGNALAIWSQKPTNLG